MENADPTDAQELMNQARTARERAYAPYSRFKVGAALLDRRGRVHLGCNVENAAYSPTNCAERTALFAAIAAGSGRGDFVRLAIIGDTEEPLAPCGVCRQVLLELCDPDMPVDMGNLAGRIRTSTVSALLPAAFGASSLRRT